jgi:hypothetical protein
MASIAWCVIPVPVSLVVAYRSQGPERRLVLLCPDSCLLRSVLRRSWVGSVGWLRSWVVGVLEGLLRYTAS